ncbi:MAG TPA: 2TM domain-containing protein [Polyangiaceae bacterium]|jgi:hypothetical protein
MEGDGRGKRVFTQEEVNAILSRAVERQSPSAGSLTYDELVDAARQAGISTEAIDDAIGDVASSSAARVADDEVKLEVAARSWTARRAFAIHFTAYVMVMALLTFANWISWRDGDRTPWVFIPALGWGIGLATHLTTVLFGHVFPDPKREIRIREELGRHADRKREERERREEKERARASREAIKQNASDLGRAVQHGMANLLADVAKNIREAGDVAPHEAERAKGRRGRVEPGGREPRARFDVRDREPDPRDDDETDDHDAGKGARRF